jgi:O-antigen ligase
VVGLAGFIVDVSDSRTGFFILATAAVAHAVLLWWRTRREVAGLPAYGGARRTVAAAAVPFLTLAAVLALAGPGFLTQSRYSEGDVTSGRTDIWKQVVADWRHAGIAGKTFGDATTTRAVVKLVGGDQTPLTTDNALVGALRRGGVLGVVAFLVGLGLLLWHACRRDAPAWFIVAVLASLPPIATSDALLGGTGGTVWVLLLTGEAWLVFGRGTRDDSGATGTQRVASTADA